MPEIHNIEAEQALIGAIICDASIFRRLSLLPEHFYDPVHGLIIQTIADRLDAGKLVDGISLKPLFEGEAFSGIGGLEYLAGLMANACSKVNAKDYASLLKDLSMRRALHSYGEMVQEVAISGDDALAHAQDGLGGVLRAQHGDAKFVSARDAAEEAINALIDFVTNDQEPGLSTGISTLDEHVCFMNPEELIVIAGTAGMGKTLLACNIAFNAALNCPSVLFFSKEMSRRQLAYREVSRSGRMHGHFDITYRDLSQAKISKEQVEDVRDQFRALPSNLVINDSSMMSVPDIREACYQHGGDIGLIVIDYLQILNRPEAKGRNDPALIGEMTRSLKGMAREFQCPVIVLSQLSRSVDARDDKHPRLSDLKESGSIEQDADKVWFVYRENYYLARSKPKGMDDMDYRMKLESTRQQMDVYVAKTRMGPIGNVRLHCELEYGLVKDIEQ